MADCALIVIMPNMTTTAQFTGCMEDCLRALGELQRDTNRRPAWHDRAEAVYHGETKVVVRDYITRALKWTWEVVDLRPAWPLGITPASAPETT